jgi:DNA-binding response OmpR family regulator
VLRKIKTDPEARSVPVVMLTSSQEERDIVDSYELGVNSYIVKPVDFDKFLDMVAQVGLYWSLVNKVPTR